MTSANQIAASSDAESEAQVECFPHYDNFAIKLAEFFVEEKGMKEDEATEIAKWTSEFLTGEELC